MSQNLSSIQSSQTKSDDPYNLSLKHDDGDSDNENVSQIMNAGVVCCNTKLVQALKDPRLAETLTLLADPTVLNSLRALKKTSLDSPAPYQVYLSKQTFLLLNPLHQNL